MQNIKMPKQFQQPIIENFGVKVLKSKGAQLPQGNCYPVIQNDRLEDMPRAKLVLQNMARQVNRDKISTINQKQNRNLKQFFQTNQKVQSLNSSFMVGCDQSKVQPQQIKQNKIELDSPKQLTREFSFSSKNQLEDNQKPIPLHSNIKLSSKSIIRQKIANKLIRTEQTIEQANKLNMSEFNEESVKRDDILEIVKFYVQDDQEFLIIDSFIHGQKAFKFNTILNADPSKVAIFLRDLHFNNAIPSLNE